MARRRSNSLRFPGAHGVLITDVEYRLLLSVIGPFYGPAVEAFLTAAPAVPGGRCLDTNHPDIDDLLGAIGCEVHGYQKLDDERSGGGKPVRGGTVGKLLALYERIEGHLP